MGFNSGFKGLNYNLLPCSDAVDHSPFIVVQKYQRDITCRKFVHPPQTIISRNTASTILIPWQCSSIFSCHGQRTVRQVGSTSQPQKWYKLLLQLPLLSE